MSKSLVVCIAGAGSTYTPGIINTLLSKSNLFPVREVRLYDIDADQNHRSKIIIEYLLKKSELNIKLITTTDPKTAFEGVDYIFSQIRSGGLKMREYDEKIPLQYGLVGQETCGLGGFSYGLRSIKGFLQLMAHITKYAPDAWILNYTNPETIIAEAVRREYPNAKIINACDMVISVEKTLADIYNYDHDDWIVTYYGLNHFGWFKSIFDRQTRTELMPTIINRALKKGVWLKDGDDSWKETYKNLGTLIEYFPDAIPNNYLEYYLMPDMKVKSSNPDYTRANHVMDNRVQYMNSFYDAIISKDSQLLEDYKMENEVHGQYIMDIAISHYNDLSGRFNLIVPNMGAIPNLREDAVVEIACYVNAQGVVPISLREDISDFHKGLMEAQVAAEKLLVDAYFENSYLKALQAFTLNQTVPSMIVAKQVLDDMIKANGDYWPNLE